MDNPSKIMLGCPYFNPWIKSCPLEHFFDKKNRKIFFDEKNVKSSRNIMNEKPHSELGEKTSEIFYSGNYKLMQDPTFNIKNELFFK